jgi:NADH-quinone oxidoreductase subunit L
MLIAAGVTALYTLRCLWMVFFARPEAEAVGTHAPHGDAGPAMKVALIPLALGSLVTWLLAGPFHDLLSRTLPFHFPAQAEGAAERAGTWDMAREVILSPSTWIALAVVALGILVWLARGFFIRGGARMRPVRRFIEGGFGFEAMNGGVVKAVLGASEGLRVTQSGLLNWNVAAIVMAVVALLLALVLGG